MEGISYNNDLMSTKLKGSIVMQAFCLLFLLSCAFAFSFKELKVTATSYTTNVTTTYSIFYDRTITNSFTSTTYANATTSALNSSSPVTVTFPIQYTLTSNITCSYQINSTGSFIANTCTQLNNQITLSNIFTSGFILANMTLLVGNVLNPYPAGKTSNFTGTIGIDVSVANGVNSLVTITAATSICSFTFSPNLVYSTQGMVFTLTNTNQFPSSGTIQAQFPLTRLWSQELDSTRLLPITTSMVCGNQSSGVNSAIQCTGSTAFAMVTFSNVVSASLSPGSIISFSINSFYAPPTNQPADAIVVTTYTGSSAIDTCNAYVTGLIPQTIPSSQFFISEINNQAMVVNSQYTIKFDITTLSIISLTDYFVITFPTGTSINNFATADLSGTVGFNSATSTYYNQVLTLNMQGTGTLQPGQIFITISNFVAPPSTLTTGNFQFQIMSNNYPKMVSYQTIKATTGPITGSATMAATTVNAVTSFTFSIKINNPITSAGFLKMTFPTILKIANSTTCAIVTGTFMASIPFCNYNPVDNSITLTNLNTSTSNIPAQTFTMVVSGITNPPSTTATAGFTITTYYNSSSSAQVDSGTIAGVTATPATIDYTKIEVLSSSLVTSDTSVTYYLSFVVQNAIPIGGFVIVYFPTSINFDVTIANSNCQIMVNSSAAASSPCSATLGTSYAFNFSNPFPSSPASANTNITLIILNAATNPPTTQPIAPFSIQTFYSDGSSIANVYNVFSYTKINTPSSFTLNQISKVSNQNGAFTSFTVTLSQIATLQANAVILVTFPSTLQPQASSTCSIAYLAFNGAVACGLTGSTFKVIGISSQVIAGTSFIITFTNIRNALSFNPISGFVVTTKTSTNQYSYSSSTSTGSVSNSIPSQFTSLSYLYTPQQLNASVSLQLTFQLSQYTLTPGYLQVSIDGYFSVNSLTCSAFIDFAGNCTSISSNTIRISGNFNNSVMGFTIGGFSSQSYVPPTTTYSVLNTFDASGFKIDESANNITFFIACNLPCMTCSTSNASHCITCYSSTLVTASIYYHSSTNYCYSTCPATTYNNNATFICSPCNSNCLTCSGSATFCTKCVANSTFPYLSITNSSQTCVSQCVTGFYPDSTIDPTTCVVCKSPCATCTSAVVCITCISGFYFLGNTTCTTACTNFTTIANNNTRVCDPCSAICLTCVGTIDTCTACASPAVYYNGSCQSSCPSGGSLAPFLGICTPCSSNCVTCINAINNCTSCNLNSSFPFLVNNTCISSCPDYYYNQSSTGTCFSCVSANINCKNCSSISTCYSCDTAYVLYNSNCINFVPTGYVNMSGVAVACTGDCRTCAVTPSNCTACKNNSLQGNNCVTTCATGTISVSNVCVSCITPCLTCSISQNNCTSCIPTLNPPQFLSINTCQLTCPNQFYPNSANFQCTACTNNCLLCSSATVCISCANGTSLYNTSCLATCPAGFTGISGVCQQCTNNCKTCSGGTNICITCNPNTYFINSSQSCATTCNSSNLFIDFVLQTCVGCSSTCASCVNTSSTCTSCTSPAVLYSSQCIANCPTGMFVSQGACAQCQSGCSSCFSLSNCSGCAGTSFLYNGQCITTCPATSGFVLNGQCTACTGNACYSCTSADICLSCKSSFLFLNSLCISKADGCPTGYSSNGTHCVDILDTTLSSDSSPSRSFPVPFTIAGLILVIACLMSRLQFHQTYLSGAIFSLIALLEVGALCLFLYLYYIQYMAEPVALYIGLGALAFLYIMNIVAAIAHSIFLCYQKEFVTWTQQSKFNKCFYWFSNIIGLVINHKFKNILFCKLFTFKIFCAKLDNVQHFRIFNIFSLISLIHSGAAIFAAGIAITKTNTKQQLFHECIDVIVLTGLNIVMSFFNTHKDKTFFEEYTPEGYSLHKKNNMIQEHLVGSKFNDIGEDGEVEEGYTTGFNHALVSKQALQFQKVSEESYGEVGGAYSDSSLADITEKCYEEISVQALDLIDQNEKMNKTAKTNIAPTTKPVYEEISIQADELIHQSEQRGINLSELPAFDNDTSNFTNYNYFKKVDRSVQGNLDRGVNFSMQFQADLIDESVQNDNRLGNMVDFSIQKFDNMERNDFSVQKNEPAMQEVSIQKNDSFAAVDNSIQYSTKQKDASFQYSNHQQDESVAMSKRSRSFGMQQGQSISDKSISAYVSMYNQSNQLSVISQEDQEVQMEPEIEERGIQPTIQFEDEAVQQELSYDDYGIQPDIEYNEVAVQPTLDPSNNQIAVQYSLDEPVNYNEFQQDLGQSNTASNMVFQPTQDMIEAEPRNLVAEKVEELQLKNENIRSYQQQLEQRIRNKEKELQEIKRKIDFKERMNEKKKEEIARKKDIIEDNIELQGIKYVEQRPQVIPQKQQSPPQISPKIQNRKQSSNSSRVIEEIQVKRTPEYNIEHIDLEIQSKQMPKEILATLPQRKAEMQNMSHSSGSAVNETLEEIKIVKEVPEDIPSQNRMRRKEAEPVKQEPTIQSKREKTIQQVKYQEINKNPSYAYQAQAESMPHRIIEEKSPKKQAGFIDTKPDFTRRGEQEKKQIQYEEYQNDLLSQQEEVEDNIFVRSNEQPTPKRNQKKQQNQYYDNIFSRQEEASPYQKQQTSNRNNKVEMKASPNAYNQSKKEKEFVYEEMNDRELHHEQPEIPRHIEVRDMGNMELETSQRNSNYEIIRPHQAQQEHNYIAEDRQQRQVEDVKSQGNHESQATKKNYYASNRKNVVIDVTEIDQSLKGQDDYIELEDANQSEPEPAGINNAYHSKPRPNYRDNSHSDLSGTIEQIPRHYDNGINDNEKTLSNNDVSYKKQTRPAPVQIDQQKLTNYFTGNIANTVNNKGKTHEMPAQGEPQQFRINRLYSNNNKGKNEDSLPRNIHQREKKNNTLAMAGKAQFTDDKLMQKKNAPKNPLNVNKQWQAQHEDKYISEDDQFNPSNRNNLVRKPVNKNLQNFASHLVLPQETDKQDTSFKAPKREERAPMSGKLREVRPTNKKDLEEIQVHFQSELSRDLSINEKNRSPQVPRGFSSKMRANSNLGAESSIYQDESQDVDYRKMMILGQMQPRPGNGDLQEYYQRKNDSKQKRRKSNSRIDRSTEKIYMQKLDKGKR